MTSLAVFDTPPLPEGWEGREVVRIVDPLGNGVAWIDPRFAGLCIGYFLRDPQKGEWIAALETLPPSALDQSGAVGCEFLWFAPDRMPIPMRSIGKGWTFETRDPTSVTVIGEIDHKLIHLTSRCEDGVLEMAASIPSLDRSIGSPGFRLHISEVQLTSLGIRHVGLKARRLLGRGLGCEGSKNLKVSWGGNVSQSDISRFDFLPRCCGKDHGDSDETNASITLGLL